MQKIIFWLGLLCCTAVTQAQNHTITGFIFDQNDKTPLGFASVTWLGTPIGTVTQDDGSFSLKHSPALGTDQFIVSFVGYQSDTITMKMDEPMKIYLSPQMLDEVVIRSGQTLDTEVIQGEFISKNALRKAACCNLSESFETNASVDVGYTDAISGTKQIRMLGLDGIYTQILSESLPAVRGLAIRNGLNFVPGTWITSIDVNKGTGSVVNGYESVTGQINLEMVKPDNPEKWFGNFYLNGAGRTELNLHTSQKVSDKWATALLLHGSVLENTPDRNNDGFRDIPESRQVSILNRWKYKGENVRFQIGVKALYGDRLGGQTDVSRDRINTPERFGFRSETQRGEVFGKIGFFFPEHEKISLGNQFSVVRHEQTSLWGVHRFEANQTFVSWNSILETSTRYMGKLDGARHGIKLGASFMYDRYDQQFDSLSRPREEVVPGVFAEHTWRLSKEFTLVSGLRADAHNLHGLFLTPRFHAMYHFSKNSIARVSAGRGLRYANPIPEQFSYLQNNRQIFWADDLEPEIAWNFGGSFSQQFAVGVNRYLNVVLDFYHTRFENQIITDLDSSPYEVRFENLDGKSFGNSFQVQVDYELLPRFDVSAAYKYYDLQATIGGELRRVPFVAKDRVFLNLAYETLQEHWKFDLTGQWFGVQRLPDTSVKPAEFRSPSESDPFMTWNAQVTHVFSPKWEVYLGGENLFGFRQDNPIISADDPSNPNFEASLIFAPILGRMVYAGVRFTME
ncbi:MAG: TonB-dependent receptor [Bacteroidota bacterium]